MQLSPESWRRAFALFDRIAEVPPDRQSAWIEAECGDEAPDVLAALRDMLESDTQPVDRIVGGALASAQSALDALATAGIPNADAERVGPWRLVRRIGQGGMGVVYLAERADGEFDQRVALKRIRHGLDGEDVLGRFLRERRILARLQHPNIARLIDGGADGEGRPYFAMEYVEGEPIATYCDERRLTIDARLRLFLEACRAVEFAHRNLVVHRDLKPSNILVTSGGTVKLLDFGIAKLLAGEDTGAGAAETRTELPALTPAYAAPEQIRGEPATTATDVHALGAVLYELLAGRRAHEAPDGTPHTLARMILDEDPTAPSLPVSGRGRAGDPARAAAIARARSTTTSELRRDLRGDLDAIVLTALRREPDERYRSVDALSRDVERYLARLPIQARRAPVSLRIRKFVARHRLGVAASVVLAAVAALGGAATMWQARAAARQGERAAAVTAFLTSIFRESEPSEARGARVTAREVLDRGAARVQLELASQPDVQAEMLRVIGDLYRQLGLLDQAAPLLEQALGLARTLHGTPSAEAATALDRWGVLLWDRGDYDQSAKVLEEALAMRRRLFGRTSAEVSASLSALASVYSDLDRSEEAEQLHREAYEIDRARFGDDSLQTATSLTNLAIKLEERGATGEAEPMQRRALDVRRRVGGANHPDVADSLLALGVLLSKRGDYPAAETHLREGLAIGQRVLGQQHPKVAHILDNLATVLEHRGALADSLAAARDALAIRRSTLEPSHPDLALSVNNFAATSFRLGFFEDAERSFREAHDTFVAALGPEHNYASTAMANLGFTLRERSDLQQAEALTRQALDIRRRTRGDQSQEVAQSLRNLGLILADAGQWAEAERAINQAVEISRRAYASDHPRLAETLVALGRLELQRQRPRDAEAALREALRIRIAKLDPGSWQVAEARMYLAVAVCAAATADEARKLFADALAAFGQPGQPVFRAADARMHQGACLGRLGRVDEGADLIRRSLEAFRAQLGDRHYLTEAARRELARLGRQHP